MWPGSVGDIGKVSTNLNLLFLCIRDSVLGRMMILSGLLLGRGALQCRNTGFLDDPSVQVTQEVRSQF